MEVDKYMLVISYCEEETYLYDSLEEMLKAWNANTIEDILKKSSWLSTFTVYKISKIWSDIE